MLFNLKLIRVYKLLTKKQTKKSNKIRKNKFVLMFEFDDFYFQQLAEITEKYLK